MLKNETIKNISLFFFNFIKDTDPNTKFSLFMFAHFFTPAIQITGIFCFIGIFQIIATNVNYLNCLFLFLFILFNSFLKEILKNQCILLSEDINKSISKD